MKFNIITATNERQQGLHATAMLRLTEELTIVDVNEFADFTMAEFEAVAVLFLERYDELHPKPE